MGGPPERDPAWTIARVLGWTQQHFKEKGIETPRLDAELLLAHVLGTNRVHLYTHYDKPLSEEERAAFRELVKRRALREPVAQILGKKEFYGRDFEVTRDVLTPRPETEHVVDATLEWARDQGLEEPRVLDVGTGSGVIAITLALEIPNSTVVATDISPAALQMAERNARAHVQEGRIEFLLGDLFEPIKAAVQKDFDLIVSNPPYIDPGTRADLPSEVVGFEPEVALFAADQGLGVIGRLVENAWYHLKRPGLLAFEIGFDQRKAVEQVFSARQSYSEVRFVADLQGHPRCALAGRR